MLPIVRRSLFIGLASCALASCQPDDSSESSAESAGTEQEAVLDVVAATDSVVTDDPASTERAEPSAVDLVGEWSSRRRGDTAGETVIFARDGSVVLRDDNAVLQVSAPVPTGGRLAYQVDETTDPARLDLVIENGDDELVTRIPGIVKALTEDQVQVCISPQTLNRPVDFSGPDCVVLTQFDGADLGVRQAGRERDIVQEPPPPTPDEIATGQRATWFVIVGGARDAAAPTITERQRELARAGFTDAYPVNSDYYPGLNPGYTVLVLGPLPRAEA